MCNQNKKVSKVKEKYPDIQDLMFRNKEAIKKDKKKKAFKRKNG